VEAGQVLTDHVIYARNNTLWVTQSIEHDLDGDGYTDLLFRNTDTGAWRAFTIGDGSLVTNGTPLIWSNLDWVLQSSTKPGNKNTNDKGSSQSRWPFLKSHGL